MRPKISIIIPTYNEEKNIKLLFRGIHNAFSRKNVDYELIFIDDHSTDRTRNIILELAKHYPVTLYMKQGARGKAQSLLEGFSYAKAATLGFIDADLQYPPDALYPMYQMVRQKNDVVVANRKVKKTSVLRNLMSSIYKTFFGRVLFNLPYDVQSGMKVFKRKMLEKNFHAHSAWTFDLEFLVLAQFLGGRIASYDITFNKRHAGKSKISIVFSSLSMLIAALQLRYFRFSALKKSATDKTTFVYKGKTFKHYTALSLSESAVYSLVWSQKLFLFTLLGIFIGGLMINWHATLIVFVSMLTVIYFADLLFNFFLIFRSFSREPEVKISALSWQKVPDNIWPLYTIFCPLYKEVDILPQFISAIQNLDYPKQKLQVLLLLEEDDHETIQKISQQRLPVYFETIVVPDSLPKTKPKALNYGLSYARGEYMVIYDAEDIPEPQQLKKAILTFGKLGRDTVCVQAKLNFYNSNQNLLTRLFTAEYSLWFDLVLTGLQSVNALIPLGGTSNHFRLKDIQELGGWDAFNVTEDADLGVRIVKRGYKTAIIDSYTYEEANSRFVNWFKQRSRWIKGYIQTYFVHMRRPLELATYSKKPHLFTFQLIIGGKIFSMLVNPFMWLMTILYFVFQKNLGGFIQSLYIQPIYYMGVFTLVIGNFLYVYYYMMGVARRGRWELMPYVLLVPLYWLFMSAAAVYALWEFITRPYFWSKTKHGLHLKRKYQKIVGAPQVVVAPG